METSNYALVLTGAVLPGHAPESVWPALAAYFRMEPDKLANQLVARAPLTVKQSDDLGKLQTLQAGAAAAGAEAEICAPDGRPALFVLLDNAPRGPVPRVFVEERVEHGLWPRSVSVAEVGSNTWRPFQDFLAPSAAPPPMPPAEDLFSTRPAASASVAVTALPSTRTGGGETLRPAEPLPAGEAIHAGFWRRCAAMVIDGILLGIASSVVQAIVGVGLLGSIGAGGDPSAMMGSMVGAMMVPLLILFVGQWLYFALFESGSAQATLGKMAFGIKVVDDVGERISFGRATGRYFGKIVSGLILNIGYLLAGWTSRKQALHDMMAGTLVVFGDVKPGQSLPTVRPPMPWYGWLLNILLIGGIVLGIAGFFLLAASLGSLATGGQGGSGF